MAADIDNVKIIAIGREEFSSNNGDWTNGKDIPVLVAPSPHNTWSNWEAYQRALFFLDSAGNFINHFSITPWNYGGDIHSNDLVYAQINSIIENSNSNYAEWSFVQYLKYEILCTTDSVANDANFGQNPCT